MPAQNPGQTQHTPDAPDSGEPGEPQPRRRRTPRPPLNDDYRPALQRRSDTKRQQAINFDLALLEYMRRAVIYMSHRHPEVPGSESLPALVDQAVREKLDSWERAYTGGKALPMLGAESPAPEPEQTEYPAPPTPEQVEAFFNDPDVVWEAVPDDQAPPLAEDETVRVVAEDGTVRVVKPLGPDVGEAGAPVAALTWSGLLGDFLALARRTVLGRS